MASPLTDTAPRHKQVAAILRNRILSGDLPPNTQLPTEQDLIGSYKVSRTVVRQAMQTLEFEGLISRVAGKGTFVRQPGASPNQGAWTIDSLEDLKSYGLSTRLKILGYFEVPAPLDVSKALHISARSPVVEIRGLRATSTGPLAYQRNFLLLEVGRAVRRADLTRMPMLDAMERFADIRVIRATQWLTAVAGGAEEAKFLRVKKGAPLLQIRRLFLSHERGPVEFGVTHLRPDRYTHVSELARQAQ